MSDMYSRAGQNTLKRIPTGYCNATMIFVLTFSSMLCILQTYVEPLGNRDVDHSFITSFITRKHLVQPCFFYHQKTHAQPLLFVSSARCI